MAQKRCSVCFNVFDTDTVNVYPRDKDNFDWWTDDMSYDHFKDYPETPGLCSSKCLHVLMAEAGEE